MIYCSYNMKHKTKHQRSIKRIARQNMTAWYRLVLRLTLSETYHRPVHVAD